MCYLARTDKGPTLHDFKKLNFMKDLATEIREIKAKFPKETFDFDAFYSYGKEEE